ncbi:MAG: DinB family protein [Chloroflexi bacterium]|nr:DinB family protein [Chloroflexota bacterium]
MTKTIPQESFSTELFAILEETFEIHHGIYLDKGTSLFATLSQISADEASIPVGNRCATIAAQVEHVIFYLEVLERCIAGQDVGKQDWGEIWSRVSGVTAGEWNEIRARLKATYDRISKLLRGIENWEHNDVLGDSLAIVVHTAYHLGEIRQALCTVR